MWDKNMGTSLSFCRNSRVRQTDGRTDRQTDNFLMAIPCVALHAVVQSYGDSRSKLARVTVKCKLRRFYGATCGYSAPETV